MTPGRCVFVKDEEGIVGRTESENVTCQFRQRQPNLTVVEFEFVNAEPIPDLGCGDLLDSTQRSNQQRQITQRSVARDGLLCMSFLRGERTTATFG